MLGIVRFKRRQSVRVTPKGTDRRTSGSIGGRLEVSSIFRAPSSAICSWALALIPSPIASNQMTLATPMKIPKTVNRERRG